MITTESKPAARLATLSELRDNILPNFLVPVPTPETCRAWFDAWNIPRFKSNPLAKRGGGPCFYSVAAVEKQLRIRMMTGRTVIA